MTRRKTPKTRSEQSRLPRYDWDKWFAKKRFKLLRGGFGDYQCKTHGMAAQIRNAAHNRGLSVSLSIEDGSIEVEVVGKARKGHRRA